MEKLVVTYQDNSQLIVSNKKNGMVLSYFYRNVGFRSSVKSATIQRYPKNKFQPTVLVSDGKAVLPALEEAI